MPACATSRYALGAGGVGAARPTPAASLISASRYALGARHTAHGTRHTALRAEDAARLCRAAQQLAAIAASRYALGADGILDALRARAPAAARSRPRAAPALGDDGVGAARPGASMCPPPNITRALPLSGGHVEDVVGFALLENLGARRASRSCRGRGGGGCSDIIMHGRAGERLSATAACAVRVGAARLCNRSASEPRPGRPPAL